MRSKRKRHQRQDLPRSKHQTPRNRNPSVSISFVVGTVVRRSLDTRPMRKVMKPTYRSQRRRMISSRRPEMGTMKIRNKTYPSKLRNSNQLRSRTKIRKWNKMMSFWKRARTSKTPVKNRKKPFKRQNNITLHKRWISHRTVEMCP